MFCNSLQIFLYRPVIGSGYECGSWLFITVLDLCHFVRIRIRLNQSDQNLLKIVLNSADWTKLREKLGFLMSFSFNFQRLVRIQNPNPWFCYGLGSGKITQNRQDPDLQPWMKIKYKNFIPLQQSFLYYSLQLKQHLHSW